jgi:hypothetical protein
MGAGIAALSLWPAVAAVPALALSFRAAAAVLLAGALLVGLRAASEGRALRVRWVAIRRAHWVQAIMHASLYTGWAASFQPVVEHVPHIAAQLLFYYGFEVLVSWLRRDEARTGFGPLPIVGSTNLFLWFRDDWFLLQFAMLAVGALAKELLVWEREGRRAHVFNPSSFPLFLVCVALWATGQDGITWARDIAVSQGAVPHAWLGIFLLGLVVQSLFAVTLVTLLAVATLAAVNFAFTALTGVYAWVDVGIPAAVYLGCHFLVTDPATSPRPALGRAAFGVLYGASVFGLYMLLAWAEGPAWYDKLLCVPFLNLLVRPLDRLGAAPPGRVANLAHVALGAGLFAFLSNAGIVGHAHPGRDIAFWEQACREDRFRACRSLAELVDEACHEGQWARCEQYAWLRAGGASVARDLPDAGYHLTLACQEGVASACDALPGFLAHGGEASLAAACEADHGLSCLVLGSLGVGGSASEEGRARARERVERACALEVPEACAWLAR